MINWTTKITCKLLGRWRIKAIAIWPFIFVAREELKEDGVLINHEKIHHAQQKEMLLIGFYIYYLVEYLIRRIGNSHWQAYRKLSHEREAKENETNLNYLKHRKPYSFLKYLKR